MTYKQQYPGLYYFNTFTFTTLGTTGHRGPDSSKTYANAPWREGDFYIKDGQQYWTVPANGVYSIEAAGAYGAGPGRVVSGQVKLNRGQTLKMLVGQRPTTTYAGGGTFVTSGGVPLIVASGGDGTGGQAGAFSPYGTGQGSNGAGYFTDGIQTDSSYKFLSPKAYVNGGFGNRLSDNSAEAGFGGGNLVGAGGYTGSDGVSGATCYPDTSVINFTDLGATSNSSGYVTVSLVDPKPLVETWSWTQQWSLVNQIISNGNFTWFPALNAFIAIGAFSTVLKSSDAKTWTQLTNNLPTQQYYNTSYTLIASLTCILALRTSLGVFASSDAQNWTLVINAPYIFSSTGVNFVNGQFVLVGNDGKNYLSSDGTTWTTVTPNVSTYTITYGNNKYIGSDGDILYSSTDLITWTAIPDSNVATSINGWHAVLYDNQTFVALKNPFGGSSPQFSSRNSTMSPRPQIMVNNPIYNITSLTFTGEWVGGTQAHVGDLLYFSNISNFAYTVSPATYGSVTATDSGSVTISLASSTISALGSLNDYITLGFTRVGTDYTVVTSPDGITWYGRTTPSGNWATLVSGNGTFIAINYFTGAAIYSSDGGVTWNSCIGSALGSGVYSPLLNYFAFTDGSTFSLSLEGKYIVPARDDIVSDSPCRVLWADTLGLFVVASTSSILVSSNGTSWTRVLQFPFSMGSPFLLGPHITWGNGTIIISIATETGNTPYVYTSTDGTTWTQTSLAGAIGKSTWSKTLGMFVTGEGYSRDGKNWTYTSGPTAFQTCVSSSSLILGSNVSNTYYSTNGSTWTQAGQGMQRIAWSPKLNLFVGTYAATPYSNIYVSTTGTSWSKVVTYSLDANYSAVTWSQELQIFLAVFRHYDTNNDVTYTYTSTDGYTWTQSATILSNGNIGDVVWSRELGSFLYLTNGNQSGMFISSAKQTF